MPNITIELDAVEARIMLSGLLHAFEDMAIAADCEGREISSHFLSHTAILAQKIQTMVSGYVFDLEHDRDEAEKAARGSGHG